MNTEQAIDYLTNPTDDEYPTADHSIFTCANCGYTTADIYTAGVINDLSGVCPECDADAGRVDEPETFPNGKGIWCNDDCGWY